MRDYRKTSDESLVPGVPPNRDPDDRSDLSENKSPYRDGSPYTAQADPAYPIGAVPGYYSPGGLGNNVNDGTNIHTAGAGVGSTDDMPTGVIAAGLDRLYAEQMGIYYGDNVADTHDPTEKELDIDRAVDEWMVPIDQRK